MRFIQRIFWPECCARAMLKGRVSQDGSDPRQGLHRLASSSQHNDGGSQGGSGGDLMPHIALQRCLDVWVPLLVDECDFAAAFLLLYRPVEEAQAAPGDSLMPPVT